jgi:hypothetical protein
MKTVRILLLTTVALCGFYTTVNPVLAQTWTQQTNVPSGIGIASDCENPVAASADGSKLVAVSFGGGIYTSTNSGVSWMQVAGVPQNLWRAVASSADGTRLMAVSYPDSSFANYISTDSGVTWNAISNSPPYPIEAWTTIACSADGLKLVGASEFDGLIYTSTNSGATWMSNNVPEAWWNAIACSVDGTKLAAVVGGGYGGIYNSSNSGTTWIETSAPDDVWWSCVASSADGTKLTAATRAISGGYIYTSTNSGASWTSNNVPSQDWVSVASSADGSKLVAVCPNWGSTVGGIYTSADAGAHWTSNDVPSLNWGAVASSADGNKLVAVAPGQVYTFQSPPTPWLNLKPSGDSLALSWIVPSANFVLQQNSDLSTTNWTDVTNMPVLNLTNLQNQVMQPLSAGNNFYRLKTP